MSNKIEVVDGVKGEWRTVTRAEEVKVGQRVRYFGCKVGFDGENRFVEKIDGHFVSTWNGKDEKNCCGDLLYFQDAQAFFPLPKSKIAKVEVFGRSNRFGWIALSFRTATVKSCYEYSSRASAIRGAHRFCKTIGFECEIIK